MTIIKKQSHILWIFYVIEKIKVHKITYVFQYLSLSLIVIKG